MQQKVYVVTGLGQQAAIVATYGTGAYDCIFHIVWYIRIWVDGLTGYGLAG